MKLFGARLDLGMIRRRSRSQYMVEDTLGERIGLTGHLDSIVEDLHGGVWVKLFDLVHKVRIHKVRGGVAVDAIKRSFPAVCCWW